MIKKCKIKPDIAHQLVLIPIYYSSIQNHNISIQQPISGSDYQHRKQIDDFVTQTLSVLRLLHMINMLNSTAYYQLK